MNFIVPLWLEREDSTIFAPFAFLTKQVTDREIEGE